MKKEDFRKIYDEIDYTDEFKAEMRKKLSQPSVETKTADGYENTVEGVEIMHRNRIIHTISTIAACGVLVAVGGAIGLGMKNASQKDSEPLSSASDEPADVIQTTAPMIFTEEPTEIITTTTAAEGETEIIVTTVPYENKLGLPDINPLIDSEEEIIEKIRQYSDAADRYSMDTLLPEGYPETYLDDMMENPDISIDDMVKNGNAYIKDGAWYFRFKDDTLTLDKITEDVLAVYSGQYGGKQEIFDKFVENDGVLYALTGTSEFAGFCGYDEAKVEIKSIEDDKIVADIYTDLTWWITNGYNEYFVPDDMQYLFGDNYRFEYPQQVTVIREDGGWRVSEFTPRFELILEGRETCPEYQQVRARLDELMAATGA